MKMKKILMLCLGALTAAGAYSQTPTVRLDLNKTIEIALDENPTVRIADLEIERQTYVKRETRGNLLPNIGIDGTYTRAVVKSELGGGVSFDADNTVGIQGSVNLPLYIPSVYKTLKLNDEQMRAAVESARGSKITLVNEVKKAYYNILLAEQSLAVLHASRSMITKTVEDTRQRLANELASEYDLITAEVQLSNINPQIIQVTNGIVTAKKLLKMFLDLPDNVNIEITDTFDHFVEVVNRDRDGLSTDVSNNTDLRSLDIQTDITRRTLEVARTQRMPTVAAFGNFTLSGRDPVNLGALMSGGGPTAGSWNGSGTVTTTGGTPQSWEGTVTWEPSQAMKDAYNAAIAAQSSSSFQWTHPISVGVQMSIPIFAGNTRVNRERQIKYGIRQLETQRYYAEKQVRVQLENAINATVTAREMMLANRQTIQRAQKGYDISQVRFEAGMGTILELNSAELSLTQAKLNYTQSIYDYLSAHADYEQVIGKEY